ncbi:hypothetical protein V3C99_003572, partial [Haemonchus contortus]|uniref:Acyl-CoA dehydrogenase n=1 Tax=Haemonchus contortus TaxID=6289 RepID=A0A7I4XYJ9_HAECO
VSTIVQFGCVESFAGESVCRGFVRGIGNGTSPMYAFLKRDRKDGYIPRERVKLLKSVSKLQRIAASG